MKLRTRIQVSFGVTMIILLVVIGYVANLETTKATAELVNTSMTTSATLASDQIAKQLKDYMNVITFVGKDSRLGGGLSRDQKISYLDKYVEAYGFTSGNILDHNGVSIEDGTDFSDREYVRLALSGVTNISDVTLSKYTGTYGVSIAAPLYNTSDVIDGVVYFRLDINFIQEIIESIKISDNSYAYLIDNKGNIIVHPDEALIQNFNLNEQGAAMASLCEKMTAGESGNGTYTYQGKSILCGYDTIENTNGWSIMIAAPQSDFTRATEHVRNVMIVMMVIAILVAIMISTVIASQISRPINKVKEALVAVAEGDFQTKIEHSGGKNEVAVLQNTTASLLETLSDIIGQTNRVLGSMAEYDLTVSDMSRYPGEFDSLAVSVNAIKSTLNRLIVEVQHSVRNVDVGSRELAQATAALSQGTVSQANSIQMLADDLGVVAERINRNSENEEVVNKKLGNLDGQIQTANHQMQELVKAVDDIETMSASIRKIVGTIDGIAFQTNILSLNASVEAARAGELGSGFAVVAEEVRNLAEKCSESSRKTAELIDQCVGAINNAKQCTDAAFESLSGIVVDSAEIARAFEEISNDTLEQAAKSKSIRTEINNISDVVQTNTATVEETAASTAVLSEQAMNLEEMVKNFRVMQ